MDEQTYNDYLRFIKTYAIYMSEIFYKNKNFDKVKNSENFIKQNNLTDIKKFSAAEIGNLYEEYIYGFNNDIVYEDYDVDYFNLFCYFDIKSLIKKIYKCSMKNYSLLTNPDITEQEQIQKLYNQLTNNKQFDIQFWWLIKYNIEQIITLTSAVDGVFRYYGYYCT